MMPGEEQKFFSEKDRLAITSSVPTRTQKSVRLAKGWDDQKIRTEMKSNFFCLFWCYSNLIAVRTEVAVKHFGDYISHFRINGNTAFLTRKKLSFYIMRRLVSLSIRQPHAFWAKHSNCPRNFLRYMPKEYHDARLTPGAYKTAVLAVRN